MASINLYKEWNFKSWYHQLIPSEKDTIQRAKEAELQARLTQLSTEVGEKLQQRDQERLHVFHQERVEEPDQDLFIGQDGNWRLRDFNPEKYRNGFILLPPEKMYQVYASLTDEYVKAVQERMMARGNAVGARTSAKEKALGKPGALYDRYEEALSRIVDFYAQFRVAHVEANKAVYLQELIRLVEQVLTEWE